MPLFRRNSKGFQLIHQTRHAKGWSCFRKRGTELHLSAYEEMFGSLDDLNIARRSSACRFDDLTDGVYDEVGLVELDVMTAPLRDDLSPARRATH